MKKAVLFCLFLPLFQPPCFSSGTAAGSARTPARDWTVLVYISARNDLALEALKDVNELEAAGPTDRVGVAVELGRVEGKPAFNPFGPPDPLPPQNDWTGSRRFLIERDDDRERITSPVLSHEPDADMGDWRRLADFVRWGREKLPARRYLLIVGGHGSGWRGVRSPAEKGISYDDASGSHIAPEELARAIKEGGGVDVYASDACLMQTMEVVYELRGAAQYVVGSQESTPGSGYDYELLLRRLASAGSAAAGAADAVVDAFVERHYEAGKRSVTISVIRPEHAAEAALALDRFAALVAASPADIRLYNEARFGLRTFDDESARDLYQLLELFYERSPSPAVSAAAGEAAALLAGRLIARNGARGHKSRDANGLSIHFPSFYMDYRERYARLSFARDTRWDEMLRAVLFSGKLTRPG